MSGAGGIGGANQSDNKLYLNNCDGTFQVASQFGQVGADLNGDVNSDEVINILDLVEVAGHFGESAVD